MTQLLRGNLIAISSHKRKPRVAGEGEEGTGRGGREENKERKEERKEWREEFRESSVSTLHTLRDLPMMAKMRV